MAIAFVRSASVYQGSATTSQDLAIDGTATNGFLVVQTRTYDGTGVSGVTYAGVSMVQQGGSQTLGSDGIMAWVLAAPTSGTNNITVTISPSRRIEIYAVLLSGASGTSVADATAWATGTGTSASGSVTTVTDNAWSVAFTESNGATGTPASGTNCTAASGIADRGSGGYGGPKTPAGSFTQAMTWTGSGQWSFFQIAVAPFTASGPANVKTYDGLATASVKTFNGLAWGSVKTFNGLN